MSSGFVLSSLLITPAAILRGFVCLSVVVVVVVVGSSMEFDVCDEDVRI